jgi:tetratricopeptide (TPR) repeat protein
MIKRYLLVLLSFVLALMSKPMVITLPIIMMLLDYWPLKRFQSQKSNWFLWQLKEKWPLFILAIIIVMINLYNPNNVEANNFSLRSRLVNAPVAFVMYLVKTFWPHDMAIFYPFPAQIPIGQVLGTLFIIIVISVTSICMAKRLSYCFVGWLWFAIAILPVIKIVQVGYDAMADRYHYLPSIGLAVILAWGIPSLFQREDTRKKILFPIGIAFLIIFSFLTWKQCGYWKNSIKLWNHALIATENNVIAHNQLGRALFDQDKTEEAIGHFNKAISLSPHYCLSYQNKGFVYSELGQYKTALINYNESIRLLPNNAENYYGRGNTYIKSGQYQLAIKDFDKTIHLKPDYAKAYNNKAFAYLSLGQYQQALEDYNRAILLQPDYADAYNNRAFVYFNTGNIASGCHDAKKACQMGTCATWQLATAKELCR